MGFLPRLFFSRRPRGLYTSLKRNVALPSKKLRRSKLEQREKYPRESTQIRGIET